MSRPLDVLDQALDLATMFLDEGGPDAALVVRVPNGGRLGVVARPAGPRDRDRSPLAELAVLLAALRPDAAALAMPGRVRDTRTKDVISRGVLAVGIDVTGGGNRMDAVDLPIVDGPDGSRSLGTRRTLDVRCVPLSSMVLDAVLRTEVPLPPIAVAVVLDEWGHRIVTDLREPLPDDHPLRASVPRGSSPSRARYEVGRLADELERRHNPHGTVAERSTAPGVPYDLPEGWVPACPI